jgi:hypothetical protein
MLRVHFAAVFFVLWAGHAFSQQPAKSDTPASCSFSEVYRKDGWTVPGVPGATVITQRARLSNMPGVFLTRLKPLEAESFSPNIWCPQDHPGRLEIDQNEPIQILDLWSFDFNGRIFAYRINYGCEAMNDDERGHLGCVQTIFFYDMDGSGRFTVIRRGGAKLSWFMPEFIPDWAKNDAGSTSKK